MNNKFPQNELLKSMDIMACVVVRSDGKLLVLKRSETKKLEAGEWSIVGAAPLTGKEDMLEIAKRELRDELGLEIDKKNIFVGEPYATTYEGSGVKFFGKAHPFKVKVNKETQIALNEEHTEFKWIEIEELNTYIKAPLLRKLIKYMLVKQ